MASGPGLHNRPMHSSSSPAASSLSLLQPYLARWQLTPEADVWGESNVSGEGGESAASIHTGGACLLPVRWQGRAAVLKLALTAEEERGYALLQWWQGDGAARVYARDGAALLMEGVSGGSGAQSLQALSRNGQDAQACGILCQAVAALHRPRATTPPTDLVPLPQWFQALVALGNPGGWLASAQATAAGLLDRPQEVRPLHGDIHHGNVLDGGARGWLAIDPKGLWGERGFDYANLFCNPDAALASDSARFAARVELVAQQAQIAPRRLLQWVLAWAGLSAVWHSEDGTDATAAQAVGRLAAARLGLAL